MTYYIFDSNNYLINILLVNDKNYPIPANATTIKPPAHTDNQRCKFVDGEWIIEDIPPVILPPTELRKQAYATDKLIEWENDTITVDNANKIWLEYQAEGSPKASDIQALIVQAKSLIRAQYPDTEV